MGKILTIEYVLIGEMYQLFLQTPAAPSTRHAAENMPMTLKTPATERWLLHQCCINASGSVQDRLGTVVLTLLPSLICLLAENTTSIALLTEHLGSLNLCHVFWQMILDKMHQIQIIDLL